MKKRSDDPPILGNGGISERSGTKDRKRRKRKRRRKSRRNKKEQKQKRRRRRKRPLGMLMMEKVKNENYDDSADFEDEIPLNYPARDYESYEDGTNRFDKRFLLHSFEENDDRIVVRHRNPLRKRIPSRKRKRIRYQDIFDSQDYIERFHPIVDRFYDKDFAERYQTFEDRRYDDNRFLTTQERFDDVTFKTMDDRNDGNVANKNVNRYQTTTDRYDDKYDYVDSYPKIQDRFDSNEKYDHAYKYQNLNDNNDRYQTTNTMNGNKNKVDQYQTSNEKVMNEFDEFSDTDDTDDDDGVGFKDVPYDPNVQFNYTPLDYQNYDMDQVSWRLLKT